MSVSRLFHWNRKNIMKKKPTSRVYKNITEIFYFYLCSCLWKTLNMYGANTERLAYKYIHCWCSFLLLFFLVGVLKICCYMRISWDPSSTVTQKKQFFHFNFCAQHKYIVFWILYLRPPPHLAMQKNTNSHC